MFFSGTTRNTNAIIERLSSEYRVENIQGHNFERIDDERAALVCRLESRFALTGEVCVRFSLTISPQASQARFREPSTHLRLIKTFRD